MFVLVVAEVSWSLLLVSLSSLFFTDSRRQCRHQCPPIFRVHFERYKQYYRTVFFFWLSFFLSFIYWLFCLFLLLLYVLWYTFQILIRFFDPFVSTNFRLIFLYHRDVGHHEQDMRWGIDTCMCMRQRGMQQEWEKRRMRTTLHVVLIMTTAFDMSFNLCVDSNSRFQLSPC